jgi:hypothetical protein
MSLRDASRLAPREAIFIPGRHDVYGTYSERVRTVLDRYTPDVRAASIDEFYLDFNGCEGLYRQEREEDGDVAIERAVRAMCRAVRQETGLPASAGIGASRIIAKVASGRAKPEGVLLVPEGTERAFLFPLPVRKLPGIGPKGEERMLADGIRSLRLVVSDLRFSSMIPRISVSVASPTSGLSSNRSGATSWSTRNCRGSRSGCVGVRANVASQRVPSRSSCGIRTSPPSCVRGR